jgi:uncharacterized protein YegL
MKKDYTKIVFVVDRSGSMSNIADDIIGGYNKFISDQKALKHGTCDVSFYQFDTLYEAVYENTPIDFVKELDNKTFVPRGGTALLDAVGTAIKNVGNQLANLQESERPEKVLVVIITDGEENSSHTYTWDQIKKSVEHQNKVYNWQFTYIGANQDAWSVGANLGIANDASLTYAANSKGSANMFAALSENTANYRSFTTASFAYKQADLDAQKDAGATITKTVTTVKTTVAP